MSLIFRRNIAWILLLILSSSFLVGSLPKGSIAGDYLLVHKRFDNEVTLLNYPSLEEVRRLEPGSGIPTNGSIVRIMGTLEDRFLLWVVANSSNLFLLYDAITDTYETKAEFDQYMEFHFSWNGYHYFSHPTQNKGFLLSEQTFEITESAIHSYGLIYTTPSQDGNFWGTLGPRIANLKTLYQYRISSDTVQATGVTRTLETDAFGLGEAAEVEAVGTDVMAGGGYVIELPTGQTVTTYSGVAYDIEDNFLFFSPDAHYTFTVRSWDGQYSKSAISEIANPLCFVEQEDTYHIIYYHSTSQPNHWIDLIASKGVPVQQNQQTSEDVLPFSPSSESHFEAIFPIDEQRFGYQQSSSSGTDIVIVDITNKTLTASRHTDLEFEDTPFYDAAEDSLWYPGYQLHLDNEDYRFEWKFDAVSNPAFPMHKFGDKLFHSASTKRVYDMETGVVSSSNHRYSSNPIEASSGRIYEFIHADGTVWENVDAFTVDSGSLLSRTPSDSNNFKTNVLKNAMVNDVGEIYLSEDFHNLKTILPWDNRDLLPSQNYALSADKIFKIVYLPEYGQSAGNPVYHPWLHIWNIDGSQFKRTRIPRENIALFNAERIQFQLISTQGNVALFTVHDGKEMFIFDIDETTGEILGIESPVSNRLEYKKWHNSFTYGYLFNTGVDWYFSLDTGWIYKKDMLGRSIVFDDSYGFVNIPNYSKNLIYSFLEGWKWYLYESGGYRWYRDFLYQWNESNHPSHAPLDMLERRFNIYTDDGSLVEYWEFYESERATVSLFYESGTVQIDMAIEYEAPASPSDHTVRLDIVYNDYQIAGYYLMTFVDKWSGRVESNLSYPDPTPSNPDNRMQVQASGTFQMVAPQP